MTLTFSACLQSLQDNAPLMGVAHELIVPSVKSKDEHIREIGLLCLGLCTLLDKVRASLSAQYNEKLKSWTGRRTGFIRHLHRSDQSD